ncbi:MAG: hypothetical protein U0T02_06795 [Solirubrobacteraceae bacterium]
MRAAILLVALAFTALLASLTVAAAIESGPDPLTALAFLVVALFLVGIVGALRHPPDDR